MPRPAAQALFARGQEHCQVSDKPLWDKHGLTPCLTRPGAPLRLQPKLSLYKSSWTQADTCAALGRRYFARMGKGIISVYEAPDMALLDKRSLKLDAVFDFAWSPTAPILCAFQLEQAGGNLPARISLVRIPDRTELRQKNLFSVSGAQQDGTQDVPCEVSGSGVLGAPSAHSSASISPHVACMAAQDF